MQSHNILSFSCFLFFFNPLLQQVVCTQWFQRWILVLSCCLVFRHEPRWSNFVQQWGRTGVNTQVWKHPEGHVMKRKTDQGGDKAVGSENARVGDAIAALLSVVILCNMLFGNCVMARILTIVGITSHTAVVHQSAAQIFISVWWLEPVSSLKRTFEKTIYFCEVWIWGLTSVLLLCGWCGKNP